MSKDFTPKTWWYVNNSEKTRDICLRNVRYTSNGKMKWAYTDEELEDRKKHRYLAVTGPDVYRVIRDKLSDTAFETFVDTLGKLIEADAAGECIDEFPKEIADWYFNRNNHYYHEQNDEGLLDFVVKNYDLKHCILVVRNLVEGATATAYDHCPELDMEIDLDKYQSLRDCCKDTIDNISEDTVFAEAEYNLCGQWKQYKGFSEDDYKYAASCGYEGCWFMEE